MFAPQKMTNFTHIDAAGNPSMVDVGEKAITRRTAKARSIVILDDAILEKLTNEEIHTKKGPVFQTAIIAGVMAAKNGRFDSTLSPTWA